MCSEPACVVVELMRRLSKHRLLLRRGVDIERFSSFTRPRGNGLHRNQAQSIHLACSFQRSPRLMSWVLGPLPKLKTRGVATESNSTTFAQLTARRSTSTTGLILLRAFVQALSDLDPCRNGRKRWFELIQTDRQTHRQTQASNILFFAPRGKFFFEHFTTH